MLMNIICFGDSNTYGYDPRGYFGGRYDADSRWVDILAAEDRMDDLHTWGKTVARFRPPLQPSPLIQIC